MLVFIANVEVELRNGSYDTVEYSNIKAKSEIEAKQKARSKAKALKKVKKTGPIELLDVNFA